MCNTKSCLKSIVKSRGVSGERSSSKRGETIHNLGVNRTIKNGFGVINFA